MKLTALKRFFLKECPVDPVSGDQFVFNPDSGQCDLLTNVPSCIKPFVCPAEFGNYANPLSCYSFYMCIDSTPYLVV